MDTALLRFLLLIFAGWAIACARAPTPRAGSQPDAARQTELPVAPSEPDRSTELDAPSESAEPSDPAAPSEANLAADLDALRKTYDWSETPPKPEPDPDPDPVSEVIEPSREPKFTVTVGANATCRSGRLRTTEVTLPIPKLSSPERGYAEWAIRIHGHVIGGIFVQFIPRIRKDRVSSVLALRYDIKAARWLSSSEYAIPEDQTRPSPKRLVTLERGGQLLVTWDDSPNVDSVYFSITKGRWAKATDLGGSDLLRNSSRAFAYEREPDPVTGVLVAPMQGKSSGFTLNDRDGDLIGSVEFPSVTGSYMGTFSDTRAALFWTGISNEPYEHLPLEDQIHSYLVDIDTGKSCRIEKTLELSRPAVYRAGDRIVVVEPLRTRSPAPPPGVSGYGGEAPRVAPKRPEFQGARMILFDDRGSKRK